jgi:hypothetical protein
MTNDQTVGVTSFVIRHLAFIGHSSLVGHSTFLPMITPGELLRVLLAPVIVSVIIAAIGWWRRWAWAMPVAAGAGFLAGYALLGVPRLPPRDGTDWLFWVTIPVTLLGVVDATVGRRWGWALGLAAGAVAVVIGMPVTPQTVSHATLWSTAAVFAAGGVLGCLAARVAEPRAGAWAVVAALCIAAGGSAVVVMSSNLRIVGVYGIAAAAALGPVAVFAGRLNAARSVAVVAVATVAGLLAGGRFYPDPGVTWVNLLVLLLAPALVLAGAFIPGKRAWMRGVVAVVLVAVAVAVVTGPTALSAKKAAEDAQTDPYADYYR